MNKRELTAYLERIESAKDFVESPEYKALHQEAVDTCSFLERFGTMAEVINHLRMLEERVYIIKEYLTLDEVAKYLQVSKHTVYKLTSANEITFYKPNGKMIFVRRKDLEEWIGRTPYRSNFELQRQADLLAYQMEKDHIRSSAAKKKGGEK